MTTRRRRHTYRYTVLATTTLEVIDTGNETHITTRTGILTDQRLTTASQIADYGEQDIFNHARASFNRLIGEGTDVPSVTLVDIDIHEWDSELV